MKIHILLCISLLCALPSCTTHPQATSNRSGQTGVSLASFPRVTTSGWQRVQGEPTIGLQGFPSIKFRKVGDPSTSVEIYIQGQQPARVQTAAPEFVTIMGQKIQTYGSGNEDLAFATQPFLLTAPDGKSSYYAIEFTGDALYKNRDIPQFGW